MYFDSKVNSNHKYFNKYRETTYIPEHLIDPSENIHAKVEQYQEDKNKPQIFYIHKETGFVVSLLQILVCAKSRDNHIHIRKVDTPVSFHLGDDKLSAPKMIHYEYNALDIPFSEDFEVITYSPKLIMKKCIWIDVLSDLEHNARYSYIDELKGYARNHFSVMDTLEHNLGK